MKRIIISLALLANVFQLTAQYQIIPLTGFNADVVADVQFNALSSTTMGYDASNYVFMSPSYNPTGTALPATGLINSAVTTTPGLQYQLAPYTSNNDLRLTSSQTGALTFITPTQSKELFILGSTGQGFSNANITVTFTDNSTQTFNNINFQDWFNGSDFAIKGMGRAVRTTNVIENNIDNPRIYQVKLDLLPANHYKFVQTVAFTNTVSTVAVLNIMAISIKTPPVLFQYDPTVVFITKPTGSCFSANQNMSVRIKNMGTTQINLVSNPITVFLHITGPTGLVTKTAVVSSGTLNPMGVDSILVFFIGTNSFNLFAGGTYHINTSLSILGLTNGTLQNDSLTPGHTIINYRPTPGPDYHICQGSNIPFGQGLTVQGCSTPLLDSVTITFTLGTGCVDNIGSTGGGGSTGLPANCENQYACNIANGILPALPTGAFFTTPATLTVTNLQLNPSVSTFYANANQVRFCLFGAIPSPPTLFSPGAQGANGTFPFTYSRQVPAADISAIYSTLSPGATLNMGYWESWNDNQTLSDISLNSGGVSVATLKFYYYYYLPSFEWYQANVGGSSLYALSPFNPLLTPNNVLNNTDTTGTYTFYAACSGTSICRSPVNIIVDSTPVAYPATVTVCEDVSGSNSAVVDLTALNSLVSGSVSGLGVSYYTDPGLFASVISPSSDTTGSTTIYTKVSNLNNGCYASSVVNINVPPRPDILPEPMFGLTCNCIDIVSLINPFSSVPLGSDTLFYDDQNCTLLHPNPHSICNADSVYIVVNSTAAPSCADTAIAVVDLSPGTTMIVNQQSTNVSSCNSAPIVSATLTDGVQQLFYNPIDCKKLASVQDVANGISLGTTTAEVVIECSTPFYNTQPYVKRIYQISPGQQDSATLCLYYLQDDIIEYNFAAAATSWPLLDTLTLSNLAISKVSNGTILDANHTYSTIATNNIIKTYDPNTTIWTVCFPVDNFSYFFAHPQNPGNIALSTELSSFTATAEQNQVNLKWITEKEFNHHYFVVERSRDGKTFYPISDNILSQSANGNSEQRLNYQHLDTNPLYGLNYYRLLQQDKDGKINYSKQITVYVGGKEELVLYPNPMNTALHMQLAWNGKSYADIDITDATGRKVKGFSVELTEGNNLISLPLYDLVKGCYTLHIRNNRGLNESRLFIKE